MPKMKTHRGAAKRFKITKSGKVKRAKAYKGHLLTKKEFEEKKTFKKKPGILSKADQKKNQTGYTLHVTPKEDYYGTS